MNFCKGLFLDGRVSLCTLRLSAVPPAIKESSIASSEGEMVPSSGAAVKATFMKTVKVGSIKLNRMKQR